MICLYNKSGDAPPFDVVTRENIVFTNGENKYIMVSSLSQFADDSWKRVPLYFGEIIAKRSDTKWISPDTQTEGVSKMNRMKNQWLSYISGWGDIHE